MVNKKDKHEGDEGLEITTDTDHSEMPDPELSDIEQNEENKLKTLKTKLKEAEEKNRELLEELQRTKADFLNARKRLEEDRARDKERSVIKHIEKLLPVCDSFFLAMQDVKAMDESDQKWRRGIEGTYAQLKSVMDAYHVVAFNPVGELFDPTRHEALSMVPVTDAEQNNRIINIIQQGYELKQGEKTELIRPARVTVGTIE
ncbi:MAG: nucleotide exchange factor GrpE [Patescibacteria group bacterium]